MPNAESLQTKIPTDGLSFPEVSAGRRKPHRPRPSRRGPETVPKNRPPPPRAPTTAPPPRTHVFEPTNPLQAADRRPGPRHATTSGPGPRPPPLPGSIFSRLLVGPPTRVKARNPTFVAQLLPRTRLWSSSCFFCGPPPPTNDDVRGPPEPLAPFRRPRQSPVDSVSRLANVRGTVRGPPRTSLEAERTKAPADHAAPVSSDALQRRFAWM